VQCRASLIKTLLPLRCIGMSGSFPAKGSSLCLLSRLYFIQNLKKIHSVAMFLSKDANLTYVQNWNIA